MSARGKVAIEKGRRLTGSLLVVCVLGTALGVAGGAQAAGLVTGKQIKDGTVTTKDVRDATITTDEVEGSSITPVDIAGDVRGPKGPQGDLGATGAPGLEVVDFAEATLDLAAGASGVRTATCPPGLVAVSGGPAAAQGSPVRVLDNAPYGTVGNERRSWVTRVQNDSPVTVRVDIWAACAEVR
ncbi:hypothetical protein [Nocardioides silvaticus]|uniref:hypothetical protein n=1 Tax=Nocardioides silvaticus TaxID=2201891 RepID=UPI0011B27B77|nr:hypothetical protein [Nocardioides silvaticus]